MKDKLTTKQAMWACCMFERECEPAGTGPDGLCTTCAGTGRVPLLVGVRETCLHEIYKDFGKTKALLYRFPPKECPLCHGLGYTPTEDGWRWLESGLRTLKHPWIIGLHASWFSCLFDGDYPTKEASRFKDAFISALTEALFPLAVNGEAVIKWVKENIKRTTLS